MQLTISYAPCPSLSQDLHARYGRPSSEKMDYDMLLVRFGRTEMKFAQSLMWVPHAGKVRRSSWPHFPRHVYTALSRAGLPRTGYAKYQPASRVGCT
jgi:hypothetical protein